jgi:hypothetical protein
MVATMTWSTVMEYLCNKRPRICSVCRNRIPVLSSFMTYHRVCNKINTTGATCGTRTAHPSRAPEFTLPDFSGILVVRSLILCVMLFVCLFVLFFLWSLCCLSVFDLRLLITPWVSSNFFNQTKKWQSQAIFMGPNYPSYWNDAVSVVYMGVKCLPSQLSWSYGIWIYNYFCNQCLSPLTLWVWIPP